MGPLKGFRVVEFAGIGPVPFCGMLLADLGAEVIRVDRTTHDFLNTWPEPKFDVLGRGRRSVAVDLKNPAGVEAVLRVVERADAVMEGLRPGVAERLGIGPDSCMSRNPKLVYGRMTGWGQEGPLAQAAGHDINYIALAGALHAIGPSGGAPLPPLNLVGDFGGGALYLAVGMLSALLEASRSNRGQVVDAAMVDGTASLMAIFAALGSMGVWSETRGANMLDSGAHFYGVYETADGKYVSVGAVEPQFYAELLDRLGLDAADFGQQLDGSEWPAAREKLAAVFKTKSRDQWCRELEGSDCCFAPVLPLSEAAEHPHMKARGTFVDIDGVVQPAPAPRFSRSQAEIQGPPRRAGEDSRTVLLSCGFSEEEIEELSVAGAIACR